jgi:hypothetical protein
MDIDLIWVSGEAEYFSQRDWTRVNRKTELICPSGKISGRAGWGEPSAKPITRRSEHDGYRFRLRSSSYGGQVAQPILRAGNRGEADWAKVGKTK